jgi:hypothetical protein
MKKLFIYFDLKIDLFSLILVTDIFGFFQMIK